MEKNWNFKLLLKTAAERELNNEKKQITEATNQFRRRWQSRTDYLKNSALLKKALDEYDHWSRTCPGAGAGGYYFSLRGAQDQRDPKIKAQLIQLTEFAKKIKNEMNFFYLALAQKIPARQQKIFLADPALAPYRHFLERVFAEGKHLLSEAEERILNLKETASHTLWVKMTAEFLAREEHEILLADGSRAKKNFAELLNLTYHPRKKIRDEAAQIVNGIFERLSGIAEAELNAILLNKKINDELRGYPRPDSACHLGEDITTAAVDALIAAIAGKFKIARDYYRLKARLFGVSRLAYHERNLPYGSLENKKYSYNEALRLIRETFTGLDQEFADIFRQLTENGQVDVFPHVGKKDGAFCAGNLITQPTYILINYNDTPEDVITIAHEFGHAINNELMRKKQNALNFGITLTTAEVASTFMEDFVVERLLSQADPQTRLALLMLKLNRDIATIFRQIACYRFEQELHLRFRQRGYLSKKEIGLIFQKHMKSYMGPAVEQSAGAENWWVYWSHIRQFFYNYSYASGLLISKVLQRKVRQDKNFIGAVKEFLAAGLSQSPEKLFKKMGIDINQSRFWEEGLAEVAALLRETTQLAQKLS